MTFSNLTTLKQRADRYGPSINSYDWLKFIAIFLMTIDHIGAYLLPDDQWWRVIGRLCVPMWFFLVGYSQSRILNGEILWLAIILAIINFLAGYGVFSLNILITILLTRYILLKLRERIEIQKRLFDIFLIATILSIFTIPFMEYGTIGICFAILGDQIRGQQRSKDLLVFTLLSFGLFYGHQLLAFEFNDIQKFAVFIGLVPVGIALYRFELKQTSVTHWGIRLLSRNTLHYYFYHRALLQLIGLCAGVQSFDPTKIF